MKAETEINMNAPRRLERYEYHSGNVAYAEPPEHLTGGVGYIREDIYTQTVQDLATAAYRLCVVAEMHGYDFVREWAKAATDAVKRISNDG